MRNKDFIISLAIIAASLLIFAASKYVSSSLYNQKIIGAKVFASTIAQKQSLSKITITSESGEVNLVAQDNLWRVAEENYYYANYDAVLNMIDFISAIYISGTQTTPDFQKKYSIKTFDKNGTLLDEVEFGQNSLKYHGSDKVFSFIGSISIPKKIYSWLHQPLLEISSENIEIIEGVYNITQGQKGDAEKITKILSHLIFTHVVSTKDLDLSSAASKKLIITTTDGLVSTLEIYQLGDEYYASLKLSTTKLPISGLNDYIKDNSFLYDGWLFKIMQADGGVLMNYGI